MFLFAPPVSVSVDVHLAVGPLRRVRVDGVDEGNAGGLQALESKRSKHKLCFFLAFVCRKSGHPACTQTHELCKDMLLLIKPYGILVVNFHLLRHNNYQRSDLQQKNQFAILILLRNSQLTLYAVTFSPSPSSLSSGNCSLHISYCG